MSCFLFPLFQLFEYDDIHDVADIAKIKDEGDLYIRNFTEFGWMNVTTGQNGRSIIFNTTSLQPSPENNKTGSLYFEVVYLVCQCHSMFLMSLRLR